MTQDDILQKISVLASKVQSLKADYTTLKEEHEHVRVALIEALEKADTAKAAREAEAATLLLMQQKADEIQAGHADVHQRYTEAKEELETYIQTVIEKDTALREAEHGIKQLQEQLKAAGEALAEKEMTTNQLEEERAKHVEQEKHQLHEKDSMIAQLTEQLQTANEKLRAANTERQSVTAQLDTLIASMDTHIDQLKNETNG